MHVLFLNVCIIKAQVNIFLTCDFNWLLLSKMIHAMDVLYFAFPFSTERKFSRHLIFNLSHVTFQDNVTLGLFELRWRCVLWNTQSKISKRISFIFIYFKLYGYWMYSMLMKCIFIPIQAFECIYNFIIFQGILFII